MSNSDKVQVANPQLWASTNGYKLKPIGGNGYTVHHEEDGQVGGLLREDSGFTFIPAGEAAKRKVASQNKVFTAYDKVLGPETVVAPYPMAASTSNASMIVDVEGNEFTSNSFSLSLPSKFDGSMLRKGTDNFNLTPEQSGTGNSESVADCNTWLPWAAKEYNLSQDIRDYVLTPVPTFFSDIPNTNGDSVTIAELLKFNPESGQQGYKTFKGKPCFTEHDNGDWTRAQGIILDVFLRKIRGYGNGRFWKVVMLLAYDRTNCPELCENILAGVENAYSVGFRFKGYTCSICGHTLRQGGNMTPCSHTKPRQPTYKQPDGKLVYRQCHDITGFECSSVANPAFVSAIGTKVFDPRRVGF